jgi:hypothetical protein
MIIKQYILTTVIEDSNLGKCYLQGKNFHISYITPDIFEALRFDTKKDAKSFIERFKMDETLWIIERYKPQNDPVQ